VLAPVGAELLTGGPRSRYAPDATMRYLNAAFLLRPDGAVAAVYEKQHLLPFAEYFPLPQLDFLRRQFGRVREFSPGTAHGPLATAVGGAGLLICNEALYGPTARERVDAGAEYLVNLTNDTWGGEPSYAAIAFAMSALRSVEQRRWLVRSSTSGPSAIIDPSGRVVAGAAWGARTTISAAIAARRDRTPYARVGDAFGWLCALVALVGAARRPGAQGGAA
jgi:apolipoprotein N-acyltransferase